MTLSEFLASADSLVGQEVTVEGGWLHSDPVSLWLADQPRSRTEAAVVLAPQVSQWLDRHIPPRIGDGFPYYFEARVTGTVQPWERDGPPVIGGTVRVVLNHTGRLYL